MDEKLSAEQQRIAELFGTIKFLETMVIALIHEQAKTITYAELKAHMRSLIDDIPDEGEMPQANEWTICYMSAVKSTALRIYSGLGLHHR